MKRKRKPTFKYVAEVAITMNKKSAKKEVAEWIMSTLENEAFVEGWSHNVDKLRVRKVDMD